MINFLTLQVQNKARVKYLNLGSFFLCYFILRETIAMDTTTIKVSTTDLKKFPNYRNFIKIPSVLLHNVV